MSADPRYPIIFSTDNAVKIITREKTETRRVIRPQPAVFDSDDFPMSVDRFTRHLMIHHRNGRKFLKAAASGESLAVPRCPYGGAGDLLYVKEKWRIHAWDCESPLFDIEYADGVVRRDVNLYPDDVLDGERILREHLRIGERLDKVGHPCDADTDIYAPWSGERPNPLPWRSPLFMPRTASRLTLKVEEIRIERLQRIDDAGIYAEGFHWRSGDAELSSEHEIIEREARRSLFHDAWNEMSRREAEAFEDNPWVWVMRFSVVEHWA